MSRPTASAVALLVLNVAGASKAVDAGKAVPAVPVKVPDTVTLVPRFVTV